MSHSHATISRILTSNVTFICYDFKVQYVTHMNISNLGQITKLLQNLSNTLEICKSKDQLKVHSSTKALDYVLFCEAKQCHLGKVKCKFVAMHLIPRALVYPTFGISNEVYLSQGIQKLSVKVKISLFCKEI